MLPHVDHPLDGAFEKVTRANEHLRSLQAELDRFITGKSYRPVAQPEPYSDPRQDVFDVRLILRVDGQSPWLTWGTIIGDICYNLRSALDYLVFELSYSYQLSLNKPDPSPDDTSSAADKARVRWRHIAFPICRDPDHWNSSHNAYLWAIDPNLIARFEGLQPYHRGQDVRFDWLWTLQELCNRDKHRTVNFAAGHVGISRLRADPNYPTHFKIQLLEVPSFWPLVDGAGIGRARIEDVGSTGQNSSSTDVHMNLRLVFKVAFGYGEPGYNQIVLPVLENIRDRVVEVLTAFKGDLP